MLLKALFLAIIIYFVLKTTIRLVAAMKGQNPSRLSREPAPQWRESSEGRSYDEEDVEDAKFVDV